MQTSKHNIFSKIKDSENYFIVNLLSGEADILEPEIAKAFKDGKLVNDENFIQKGYIVDSQNEEKLFKQKYLDFIDNRDSDEVQIFFVPWYSCNFNCFYCYQDEYDPNNLPLTMEKVDAFFNYINKEFSGRKKYITLFGGEPFLPGERAKEIVNYFFESAAKNDLSIAVVTNGYTLPQYIDSLKKCTIREVQVTLDGLSDNHDKRRPLKNGKGTFNEVVSGIDAVLEAGLTVNLRMVVDKDNIEDLPKLAKFAIEKGWTRNPLFKTQLGRNYELHHCQVENDRLYSRVTLYEKIYGLLKEFPEIVEFHKPAFSISKFLEENGKLPEPLFDACPATKTEWAFDYSGNIYSCTATVGKDGEELGAYYPEATLKQDIVDEWEERDVVSIPECKDCPSALACGGGCGSVAKNKHEGRIQSPDCRPVKELLEMGISYYFNSEVQDV